MAGFERYQKDIYRLANQGGELVMAIQHQFLPEAGFNGRLSDQDLSKLPDFEFAYQQWYSEALALITQLLPDRTEDFKSYYAAKGPRKEIVASNYTISDALRAVTIVSYGETVVSPASAIRPMLQQYSIICSLLNRFQSTLYDIKTLVHADLLDDELHEAEELNAKGYQRGAGAIAGVVLEGHLNAVCERHGISLRKKDPAISDLNDALKTGGVIETATWRFIQHLGDLRNKCDHKKQTEPTKDEVNELVEGVRKITKTVL
ncbi:hypothetical protein CXZ10_16895 [Pleomorphomonas diazotrophica]|uniref:DUF4145 domain-containing protein n=1 Tax=Pleomorphomonas diazotrophica TaxID=1166257 RepID=A0A1I4RQQ1_9HYPH|nr:hypothetical protein [Pleomorphomonas diazotrophica]PKR88126.1 hypothetical protein CXZ10_16895 [Pleomorphomonas diazotrophica]SFM54333.1 hypothetical protein SAMN05192571_102164 [Pleomorphomonas diazotrophica]